MSFSTVKRENVKFPIRVYLQSFIARIRSEFETVIVETRLKSLPRTSCKLNWHYNNSPKAVTFFAAFYWSMFKVWRWISCLNKLRLTRELQASLATDAVFPLALYSLNNRSVRFQSCSYSLDLLGHSAVPVWRPITHIRDIQTLTQQR